MNGYVVPLWYWFLVRFMPVPPSRTGDAEPRDVEYEQRSIR